MRGRVLRFKTLPLTGGRYWLSGKYRLSVEPRVGSEVLALLANLFGPLIERPFFNADFV